MKRSHRVALEILSPPLLAFGLAVLFFQLDGPGLDAGDLRELAPLLGFAYLVAALPSLLFAATLELAFAGGLAPRSAFTVLLAGALGALGGAAVGLLLRIGADGALMRYLVILGAATGTLVGVVILAAERLGGGRRGGLPPLRLELR